MTKNINHYLNKFKNLRVSRNKGIAPHKPILLLSIIQLIEQEEIKENRIFLNPELIATFLNLWQHLGSLQHHADIGLPFYHLKGDDFWHHQAKLGFESIVNSNIKIRTIKTISETIEYAYLDGELFELLINPHSRQQLTQVLIKTWFSSFTNLLPSFLKFHPWQDYQEQLFQSGGQVYQPEVIAHEDEAIKILRDSAFRRNVVKLYDHRCCVCQLKVISGLGENIVDGSHIKPFSQFYDDRINNGLSLCKNHHWAFDRFWFTLNNDYTITVSPKLYECVNSPFLKHLEHQSILLPSDHRYLPREDALKWHRQTFFAQSHNS